MFITNNLYQNPRTSFTPVSHIPYVDPRAFVHPTACITGSTIISENVMVAPFASVRGDEGTPIYIGKGSNIQDGVVIHGLKEPHINVNNQKFSIFIGDNVSLAHQSQIHGPAKIGNNVFVGMQSFVFKSIVGDNVVIEPGAKVIGVNIPSGRYVPAGETIKTQDQADKLPVITGQYANRELNHEVLEVNQELVKGYSKQIAQQYAGALQNFQPAPTQYQTPFVSYPQNYYVGQFN